MAFISQIIQQHPDAGYWHQQYPWFSIGQLVHTANNKETPAFAESTRRTAVFFNEIPRLHWLLHQEEPDLAALRSLVYPELQNILATTGTTGADPKSPAKTGNTSEAIIEEIPEPENVAKVEPVAPPVAEVVAIAEEANETVIEPDELTPSFNTSETTAEPTVTNDHTLLDQPTDNNLDAASAESESDIEVQEDNEAEEPELLPLSNNLLSASLAQAADNYKNSAADDDTVVFKTAYQHTIDYFASQGIQLDSEPAKDDRFGQQLKTFTSWLRQMKRLPDAPVPEADPLVESHAAHSLQKGEVVTEPMADVLLKQGKTGQAIAVLEKLRLLHPQKSHYFAARIDQLKHT